MFIVVCKYLLYACTIIKFFCTHIHFNEVIFAHNIHFQSVFFRPTSMNLFFWNQKTVTYYELIKQKVLQMNPKVISSKYDSCKFPAFRNASKVQHASLGAGSWCRLLEEVKECAAQKGNFFDCTDDSFMLQLHAGEDRHFTCTSHLTEIVKEQKYLQSPWKL